MNRTPLVASVVASALLATLTMPAAAAASAPASAQGTASASSSAAVDLDELKSNLKEVNALINKLRGLDNTTPGEDYTDQINDLIDIAFDLESTIRAFQFGGSGMFDLGTIIPRIELAATMTDVIAMATTNLQNKVSETHVELGFAVTRSALVLINPGSTTAQLMAEAAKLQAVYARVSDYRDLEDTDRATIYTKADLDRVIWETRVKRDRNVLGKKDFRTYMELNRAITKTVGVWGNAWATVGDVKQAKADLNAAYDKAVS